MTPPKLNVMMKEDGTLVPLVEKEVEDDTASEPTEEAKQDAGRPQRFYSAVVIIICLVILSSVGCVILLKSDCLSFKSDTIEQRHRIHYIVEGTAHVEQIYLRSDGCVVSEEDDGSKSFADVESGVSATLFHIEGLQSICVIYRHHMIKVTSVDEFDEVYSIIDDVELEVMMDEKQYIDYIHPIDNVAGIPEKLVNGCNGAKMYRTRGSRRRHRSKRQNNEFDNVAPETPAEKRSRMRTADELLSTNLRAKSGEIDENKDCCLHCKEGYVFCNKVCIQLESSQHSYNCEHRMCRVILPCSVWKGKASRHN